MDALLGAVWLYAADVPRTVAFYRDAVGLPLLDAPAESGFHFDAGNIRLSIHPRRDDAPPGSGGFYVFIVEDIEAAFDELTSRGVEFEGPVTDEEFVGRIAGFRDPDGHELFLWQMPSEGDPAFDHVRPHAAHYERLRTALGR